jgi:ADP-heptose:LPS heptosyltransferase
MLQRPAIAPINVVWPPVDREIKKKWAGVCRMGGVGDNLVAASVLAPLKRAGYMTEVIAQAPHHVMFENNPFMDRLIVKQKEDFPGDGGLQWQQWFDTRGREYDLFANLSHTMEHLVAFFPGQTAFYWPAPFRRKMADHSYIELVHDMFGMPHEFGRLFWPTDEECEDVVEKRRQFGSDRLVGWCLSGTRIDKVWAYAPMAISRIIRELGAHVILLGAPSLQHIEMAQTVESEVARHNGSTKGLNTALSLDAANPQWPMRRILAMAGACDLVIGPDTGPMWAVAFESMPKIMMLSHASAKNITSHWVNTRTLHADQGRVPCWPCHRLHNGIETCRPNKENNGAACISDISVETVVSTAAELLEIDHG